MTIEKDKITGAWKIMDVISGYLVSKVYFGYSKREAIKLFKSETR